MKYHVTVSQQVMDFGASLAPEPRRALKRAILALREGQGDTKALTDELSGWSRLRVGAYRVILRHRPGGEIECVFVEERRLVYEVFAAELARRLASHG